MATVPADSFEVFTSVRYDPALLTCEENGHEDVSFGTPSPFYMIRLHRDRMFEAALHFQFCAAVSLLSDGEKLEQTLLEEVKRWQKQENASDGPLMVRNPFHYVVCKSSSSSEDFLDLIFACLWLSL